MATRNNEHNILEPEKSEPDELAENVDENDSQPSQEDDNDELFWESLEQCNENTLELAAANESQFEGGHLIVWGCGEFGQHGHGHTQDVQSTDALSTPLWYGEDRLVVRIACGSSHTLIITDDNRIYSWGNSNSGQLGNGSSETCLTPHQVKLGTAGTARLRGVTCGTRHSIVWTEDGDCYSFGNNYSAQLGYDFRKPDFKENQVSPVYVDTLLNRSVTQVACGARHTLFLFLDGRIASVGSNNKGQLGMDNRIDMECPSNVPDLQNIVHIGCGSSHSLAADGSGNLYAWGYSKACGAKEDLLSPKCVLHNENATVMLLAGGDSHSMALISKVIYTWGSNYEGQLGHGKSVKFLSQPTKLPQEALDGCVSTISVGENTSTAVTDGGLLFMWGKNSSCIIRSDEGQRFFQYEPCLVNTGDWKVNKVACGSWHVACTVTPCDTPRVTHRSPSIEDHILENQKVDTCTKTNDIMVKYDTSDKHNTSLVQNGFDITQNEVNKELIDDNTAAKCATHELGAGEKLDNAGDIPASDVKQSSSFNDGSTVTDQTQENVPNLSYSHIQERNELMKDLKTKTNKEENVLSFLNVHAALSHGERNPDFNSDNQNTNDSTNSDQVAKAVESVTESISNAITTEEKFDLNFQENRTCAREVELNSSTKEKPLSGQEFTTVEQELDIKTPGSGELVFRRRGNRSTGELDDPNSLLHIRSCPNLELEDPVNKTVLNDSRSRESVTFEGMENHNNPKDQTTNDLMCKNITDDGIKERGGFSKPRTVVSSGIHTNQKVEHTSSNPLNVKKSASRDRSYSGPPLWSQLNPIPSVPSPVKREDLHYSRAMNNITLGFEGVSERVRVAPGRPVRRSSESSSTHSAPKTGRSLSTSSPPGNLRRTKKPARTFRRITSWDEQLDYVLPNQAVSMCETDTLENWAESRLTVQRTQSSPNIFTGQLLSANMIQDSPPHVPRPPPGTRKLPPRAPRAKQPASVQKLVFSSGSSWRKRR